MEDSSIAQLRRDYEGHGLLESDALDDPVDMFSRWFEQAKEAGVYEPNAMTLATASSGGEPASRIVLLKGFDANGFVFFTNYESDKAGHLRDNPRASLTFYWDRLHRQVRIAGAVAQVSREETEAYFHSRPRGSQLGAWVSSQSRVISDRGELDRRYAELEARYEGQQVPVPPHWGGYRVTPESIEFWQGRTSRLHDRLRYRRPAKGSWTMERLAP
jgi:pyridoxamine 5'-phosphate oxidase